MYLSVLFKIYYSARFNLLRKIDSFMSSVLFLCPWSEHPSAILCHKIQVYANEQGKEILCPVSLWFFLKFCCFIARIFPTDSHFHWNFLFFKYRRLGTLFRHLNREYKQDIVWLIRQVVDRQVVHCRILSNYLFHKRICFVMFLNKWLIQTLNVLNDKPWQTLTFRFEW